MHKVFENQNKTIEYHLNQYQPNQPRFSVYEIEDYLKKYDKKRRKAHMHHYHKIIWFKKGAGRYFVDFKAHDVYENTIIFVTKDQIHYFDKNTSYQGTLIHFNEEFLIQNNSDMDFFKTNNFIQSGGLKPSFTLNREDTFILDEYLKLIKNELEVTNGTSKQEFIMIYLKVFLIQIKYYRDKFNKIGGYQIHQDDKRQLKLVSFINLIEENYKNELNLSEYSKLLDLSTRSLSNLTQKLLEKTPSQLIHEKIILEAQRLIMQTNYNINEVAQILGFADSSYFVKYFKKHTSISPSDFRKFQG